MNGEWSLDVLYKGYDDPKFAEDRTAFDAACARMNELAAAMDGMEPKKALHEIILAMEDLNRLASTLMIFAELKQSVNTRDNESASISGQLMATLSAIAAAQTKMKA